MGSLFNHHRLRISTKRQSFARLIRAKMWTDSIQKNVAKLVLDDPSGFVPCPPLGVQRLIIESKININGAHVVVLGRSMIVGKPLALLLMQKNEKRQCHSHGGAFTQSRSR